MNSPENKETSLKEKIFHELAEYWITVFYLALVFATFTEYRRLILAAHEITYTNYWVAVIEALILAKVILIGDALHLGRRLEDKPLIYSTLLKTVVFSVFVGVFTIIEHMIKGLWTGKGLMGGLADLLGEGHHELLAQLIVIFAAFIPFFAFRELGRVLGGADKTRALFFLRRPDRGTDQIGD